MAPSSVKAGLLNAYWQLHQDIGWRDLPASCCCNSHIHSFKVMKVLIDACTALDPEWLPMSGHGRQDKTLRLVSPGRTLATVSARCSLSINSKDNTSDVERHRTSKMQN